MEDRRLNQYMLLKDSGELRVERGISSILGKALCSLTKSESVEQANLKIKQASRTRFKTRSIYLPEVFSMPKTAVKHWTRSMSLVSVPGLYSDLDLENGKYEGGFKVWESTADLIKFITDDQSQVMDDLLNRGHKLKALELGAGASLPSLALISRMLADPIFNSEYRIHLQDYNWQVLASLTLMNFATNLPTDYFDALVQTKCLRFFYGDWRNFRIQSNYRYDLIMMSEVIYNSDNYDALHDLLTRHLKLHGYVVIATKDTYFGLSGGLYPWLDFIKLKNVFNTTRIRVFSTNIPRSILIMKKITA